MPRKNARPAAKHRQAVMKMKLAEARLRKKRGTRTYSPRIGIIGHHSLTVTGLAMAIASLAGLGSGRTK